MSTKFEFRWNTWNVGHIGEHGVTPREAEHVVQWAKRHRPHRKDSWVVFGRGNSDRVVDVVHVKDADGTLYVIHAMPR